LGALPGATTRDDAPRPLTSALAAPINARATKEHQRMSAPQNRQFKLAARPKGLVKASDFEYVETPVPEPAAGQVLVRNLYLSIDPTNRVWMTDMPQYMPPVQIGEVMRGLGIGQVIESKHPDFPVGTLVQGVIGWQDYLLATPDESAFRLTRLPKNLPVSPVEAMGVLGMTALTAYFGLLDVGKPKAGETVVVSAAAGATGSVVGQIAKIKGCRVVGIAGTPEKCAWIKDELGFDAAVNHRAPDWKEQLKKACPNGIDIDFENVGGEILDAILALANLRARVVLCGLISSYTAQGPVPGPYNFAQILMKRLRVEGFIVSDYAPRNGEAFKDLVQWVAEGKLKHRETVLEGLQNAPSALNQLFEGTNVGKLILKIADPPTS